MDISRKQFVETMVSGSALLLLSSCGGGGSYNGGAAPAPSPMQSNSCNPAQIADNHGHSLIIPLSDLDSTTAKTYDIHGSADHTHTVTLSATQLAQLKAGAMVAVTSTETLAHTHLVSITCV